MEEYTMKYRKKPIEIEASDPINTDNMRKIADWCDGWSTDDMTWDYDAGAYRHPNIGYVFGAKYTERGVVIRTLEGDVFGRLGDRIICGVQGEFYPCKPDIFEQTYEPAD